MTQKQPISPLEYLRSLPKETIQEAYHESTDASFSKEGDRQAAEILTRHARLQGYDCQITGATLGRHRSDIGLVKHRSKRGALTPAATESPAEAQPTLELQPAPPLPAVDEFLRALKSIESGIWAVHGLLKKPNAAPDASRPVLVKEAAGGGQ